MIVRSLLFVIALLVLGSFVVAQDVPDHRPDSSWTSGGPNTDDADDASSNSANSESTQGAPVKSGVIKRWHEPIEIAFSLSVLAFGFGLIVLFTRTLMRPGHRWRAIYLRLIVLTIVVTAGLFVITAGYSQDQIAPMMGLLGTLVGYLLGRDTSSPAPEPPASTT
jgi:hypothetical protein